MTHPSPPTLPLRPYDSELQTELTAIGWQGRLNESHHEHDVVQTVRDYLARLSPEEIATMPPPCRPGRIVDADDVAEYALQLARAQCDATTPLVETLAAFLTNASLRLAQILAASAAVPSEEDR